MQRVFSKYQVVRTLPGGEGGVPTEPLVPPVSSVLQVLPGGATDPSLAGFARVQLPPANCSYPFDMPDMRFRSADWPICSDLLRGTRHA
jgi:hypothetical protein